MKISEYIKRLRKELNLTQDEFAQKIGLSRSAVAKYESEQIWGTIPPGDVLIKIQNLELSQKS